uniref:Suppressor of cytokine signaling 7 n=1 Tax=Anopheles dirus TaxID=7168 RepID=A0A182N0H0_9DIPT
MNEKKYKLKNSAGKAADDTLDCHLGQHDASETYLLKIKTWSPGKRSQCFVTLYRHTKSNISTIQRNSSTLRTRLSCSHNSLTDSIKNKADDSVFITQAMSHDALDDNKILDFYNVPIDSDIYTTPIDLIRNTYNAETAFYRNRTEASQRNSWNNLLNYSEQISSIHERKASGKPQIILESRKSAKAVDKQAGDNKADSCKRNTITNEIRAQCKKSNFSVNLKQKFCNIFRVSRQQHHKPFLGSKRTLVASRTKENVVCIKEKNESAFGKKLNTPRKLPPLPSNESDLRYLMGDTSDQKKKSGERNSSMDFTASIEKVQEFGWYWGPITSEGAEKILSNEPDGSFLVRDSSDDHYIFSLTFKLNGTVRHVRIDQDQGSFSFGSCAKFKSRTIMEFIENAVEHSRSGRYLFFLHRRPEYGPMRVQLTKPVSRFKHVQSLQHICRFVIHKTIKRKDLIQALPLPRRVLDYLCYKNCLSERTEADLLNSLEKPNIVLR